jgi:uroporphyrinogen-III synthase
VQSYSNKNIVAVFTSVNAVEAVTQFLPNTPDWKIYCLGGITKEQVYQFFGKASVLDTAKNATALSEKITANKNVEEVYFFCGDQRLDELPSILQSHNIKVNEVVVYNTIETPQSVERNYDAVIFFSPSAVHSFFSMNTLPTNVILFSIGKTTTATIQTYCSNPTITSEWPGKEQMIDQVIHYFTTAKQL